MKKQKGFQFVNVCFLKRPTWESVANRNYVCSCGEFLDNNYLLKEHWQKGHFDILEKDNDLKLSFSFPREKIEGQKDKNSLKEKIILELDKYNNDLINSDILIDNIIRLVKEDL